MEGSPTEEFENERGCEQLKPDGARLVGASIYLRMTKGVASGVLGRLVLCSLSCKPAAAEKVEASSVGGGNGKGQSRCGARFCSFPGS